VVPTGVQTLATQFWNYQQNLAYGQASPFARAMIAIARRGQPSRLPVALGSAESWHGKGERLKRPNNSLSRHVTVLQAWSFGY
jgi:hypothetical protein